MVRKVCAYKEHYYPLIENGGGLPPLLSSMSQLTVKKVTKKPFVFPIIETACPIGQADTITILLRISLFFFLKYLSAGMCFTCKTVNNIGKNQIDITRIIPFDKEFPYPTSYGFACLWSVSSSQK